jgi:hypothetical protein
VSRFLPLDPFPIVFIEHSVWSAGVPDHSGVNGLRNSEEFQGMMMWEHSVISEIDAMDHATAFAQTLHHSIQCR